MRRRGVTPPVAESPRPAAPPRRVTPPAAPPPPRRPRRELPPAARGPSYAGRRILALLVVLLVGLVVYAGLKTFQPFHGDARGAVRVKIAPGSSAGEIARTLEQHGVIASRTFFSLNATLTGRRGDLRPGTYTFARDMSYGTVLDALGKGPRAKVIKTFKLTLPEGLSVKELASRIKQADVSGDYVKAAQSPAALRRARALGLPRGAKTAEGFLFPATYDLPEGASADNLVAQQLAAFRDNFASVDLRRAQHKNLTRYDVVIIASMVEREAQRDRERPLVAAVIYNRLHDGMVLGIDATTRYEYGNWTDPLTQSQLGTDSPYNTRLNRGLPPTPIGNPGLASLKAAAHPAHVPYLYYVVKPGTCGRHSFSSTDAQFQRDVAAYNAARDRAGGKSPTTC
jgi:uncharacterized YceG family protein